MAFEAKSHLLATPLEIRHMIYRYVSTMTYKEYCDIIQGFRRIMYEEGLLKLRIKRLYKLVSICQQMRYEVLSEYFRLTLLHLNTTTDASLSIPQPYVQSAPLFTSHVQHVILPMRGRMYDQTESLDWLVQLKKLKTLYLEVTDVRLYLEEGVKDHHIPAIIEEYFGPDRVQRLAALRNRERISVIFTSCCRGSNEIAEATPEFQTLKDTL